VWDLTTGAESARLEMHSSGVIALCALPDGRLASGSADKTIRLWDLTTGAESAGCDGALLDQFVGRSFRHRR
jgi:WD40 repeat protein